VNRSQITLRELRGARDDGAKIVCMHYACESWFSVKDRPVAVSCVTFADLVTGGDTTFSVTDRKDGAEEYVLNGYFEFLRQNADVRVLHWNMNSSDFGFQALCNRLVYIRPDAKPFMPPSDRVIDLDDLVSGLYGKDYADHPKLINLVKLNGYRTRYWLAGKEEAEKFDAGDHGAIRRSTTEKAQALAFLARRVLSGTLETKTSGPHVPFAGATLDSVRVIRELGSRFLDVSRELKKRHAGRNTIVVQDEYDAQDLFRGLLRVFFGDIRAEEWTPSYAGSASRIDFVVPTHLRAIELKHSRPTMSAKSLGEELVGDVERYQKHGSVRHLVCLVFDYDGHINNPRGIEADLTKARDGLMVTVHIVDR
jgi:hypothetical protein